MDEADHCLGCDRLTAIEAIKALKARYFRSMDTKDWPLFGAVFSHDAVGGADRDLVGRAAIVELVASTCDGARTAHQGFLPEIEIVNPGQARGIWAMSDYFEVRGTDPPIGFTGYGHYAEEYTVEDGAWRISSMVLTRLKILPLAGGLPDFYRRN